MSKRPRSALELARDPRFDDVSMAEFEASVGRARPSSRAGYRRGKAATLLKSQDARAVPVAVRLLEEVIADWPKVEKLQLGQHLNVPWAHEMLGQSFAKGGDLDQAERHFRLCLAKADDNRNGTSGVTELFLAEVLIAKRRGQSLVEARDLLASPVLARRLVWAAYSFRFCLANARLAKLQGQDPSPWAKRALELAADTRPQLARHPEIGVVKAGDDTVAELKNLLADGAARWA